MVKNARIERLLSMEYDKKFMENKHNSNPLVTIYIPCILRKILNQALNSVKVNCILTNCLL